MTVIAGDKTEDRYGRYPLIFKGYKGIREVYQYLFDNYNGYKFAIMFDCTTDEINTEALKSKDLYVYFADEVLEEICYYKYDKSDKVLKEAYDKLKKMEADE